MTNIWKSEVEWVLGCYIVPPPHAIMPHGVESLVENGAICQISIPAQQRVSRSQTTTAEITLPMPMVQPTHSKMVQKRVGAKYRRQKPAAMRPKYQPSTQ